MKILSVLSALLLTAAVFAADAPPKKSPVKVFILAGQSNMQGHAHMRTMDWLGEDPQYGSLLKKVKNADGTWVERPDVWIYYRRDSKAAPKKGNLTAKYGASDNEIGPELMFGNIVGDKLNNQVLLIKTAWGGRSLAIDFRPPSAGEPPWDKYPEKQRTNMKDKIEKKTLVVGQAYAEMIAETKSVLANLKENFPAYGGGGYELCGFVWLQGWNDMIDKNFTDEYAANLGHFINDIRKDLNAPQLPMLIAEMGIDGKEANEHIQTFRKAQAEGVTKADVKDNVVLVPTAQYWDEKAAAMLKAGYKNNKWDTDEHKDEFNKIGSQPPYHYMGSAKVLSLIGMGLAEAALKLAK